MNDIRELLKLSVEERLKLIGDLWDSIEEEVSLLTDDERAAIENAKSSDIASDDEVADFWKTRGVGAQ